jgi:hypothetical protein
MYRAFALTALALLIAAPAMAADATCSTAPASKFQPKATLESQLTAEGLTVRRIKLENGCYEVYAVDKANKKVNTAYNAETLEKVGNPEAGEN